MLSRQVVIRFISTVALLAATGCSHPPTNVYQGYIEGRFVYVASPQSGRLEKLSVRRGEVIATGQPLFALDDQPEADDVQQAQKVLHSAAAKLSDLKTGKRPAEIDVTRAQLQQALAEKKQADQILESDDAQYRAGGISQVELIQARANAEMSAAKVKEMEASLAVDALPAREQQIRSQQNEVAADHAALADARWKLQQKAIASPRHGLVMDTLYRVGEWVTGGNPIVQLLPPENLEIHFFVPEAIVGSLRMGETVHLQCDGCASDIHAIITFISPQTEYTPPVIYSNENRSKLVYMVIAQPTAQQAAQMHPGQPVEVTLP